MAIEPKDGYYGNFDEVSIKRGENELNKLRAIPVTKKEKPKDANKQ